MRAWTDYPIEQLGDTGGELAPIRECTVVAYDGDKYAKVVVCGVETSFKAGYLYSAPGRCGEVQKVSAEELQRLPHQYC